jgi:hypothetical protein
MDIMFKIAIGAAGVIVAILGLGFYNLLNDNSAVCEDLDNDIYDQELALRQSAEYYRYSAHALNGQFDLPGDLAAWRNHLLNEYNLLQHKINEFEDQCQT